MQIQSKEDVSTVLARRAALTLSVAALIGCGAPEPFTPSPIDGDAQVASDAAAPDVSATQDDAPAMTPDEGFISRRREGAPDAEAPGDHPAPRGPFATELMAGVVSREGAGYVWASWLNAQRASDERCGRREIGPCVLYDCRGSTRRQGAMRVTGADHGLLKVEGERAESILIEPEQDGRYKPLVRPSEALWEIGKVVTFSASGSPTGTPFRLDLTMPEPIELLAPALGATAAIERDAPLRIRWGSVEDEVAVVVTETDERAETSLDDRTLVCVFSGAQGEGTVPAEAMQSLTPTALSGHATTTLRVGRRASKLLYAGSLPVTVSLTNAVEVALDVR